MDDLISRQMAIEVVQNRHIMLNKEKVLLINDLEKLPSAQLATDTNVGTKLGTNLAEVGTDRAVKGFPIDADDLLLRVEEKYGFRSRDRLYDIIRKMPKYELAPAEPKRGKWIKTARWSRVYYCDQCRNYLDFDGVNAGRGSTNYCPNCGAKMEVNNESN